MYPKSKSPAPNSSGPASTTTTATWPRRVSLPFQVIERVNETRATREQWKQNSQFDI